MGKFPQDQLGKWGFWDRGSRMFRFTQWRNLHRASSSHIRPLDSDISTLIRFANFYGHFVFGTFLFFCGLFKIFIILLCLILCSFGVFSVIFYLCNLFICLFLLLLFSCLCSYNNNQLTSITFLHSPFISLSTYYIYLTPHTLFL